MQILKNISNLTLDNLYDSKLCSDYMEALFINSNEVSLLEVYFFIIFDHYDYFSNFMPFYRA
jgi:hypothetical protein